MRHAFFHRDSRHEAVWGGLLVLFAFLFVVLMVVLTALYGWQLPVVQPFWNGDFFKPITLPFGPY